jgi:general L-amino acid transport system substrate-binding protein
MLRRILAGTVVALLLGAALPDGAAAQNRGTLERVRSRGELRCGVLGTIFGFSLADTGGVLRGLDVDSCRAIAAAVLGDANKARFVVLPTQSRFTALQSGEVDVLYANTTWTYGRDVGLGISFTGVNYFDGQGFLVSRTSGIAHAEQLGGATICLLAGGTAEQNMGDWFRARKLAFTPVILEQQQEMVNAFTNGRCDAMTQDTSALASHRLRLGAERYAILPEVVGTEPLGGSVAKGDDQWFDVVRWVGNAQVTAEALGVSSGNIDTMRGNADPSVRRLIGPEGDLGKQLGLSASWSYNAVKQVGNYGEMWERDIGPTSVERGRNRIWTQGGLHFSPPLR